MECKQERSIALRTPLEDIGGCYRPLVDAGGWVSTFKNRRGEAMMTPYIRSWPKKSSIRQQFEQAMPNGGPRNVFFWHEANQNEP